MYQLAVIGNPIAHSKSPQIWHEFGRQCGVPLEYNRICAPLESFEEEVARFFAEGGRALSVTAPFKARAFQLAQLHNLHTLGSQTANHLIRQADGQILADNTDGLGLVADLQRLGFNCRGKNILILGSGSVIHSVLSSLLAEQPAQLDLLMRNPRKLAEFSTHSSLLNLYCADCRYDLVINTTPNSDDNQLFAAVEQLAPTALAYDMIYNAAATRFMLRMAELAPAGRQSNGLGMLIQQAKVAFELVFGQIPDVEPLYRELLK